MAGSPIENYQQCIVAFRRARAEMEKLYHLGTALEHWRGCTLLNAPPDIHGASKALRSNFTIDLNIWPDARALAQKFADYNRAVDELGSAWNSLNADQQVGISNPQDVMRGY